MDSCNSVNDLDIKVDACQATSRNGVDGAYSLSNSQGVGLGEAWASGKRIISCIRGGYKFPLWVIPEKPTSSWLLITKSLCSSPYKI